MAEKEIKMIFFIYNTYGLTYSEYHLEKTEFDNFIRVRPMCAMIEDWQLKETVRIKSGGRPVVLGCCCRTCHV